MKRFKKTIALVMAAAMLVSIAGCHKKIKKVDEDAVIDALEDVLDLEEVPLMESYDNSDYYYVVESDDGSLNVTGHVHNDDDPRAGTNIMFHIQDDEDDAEDKFLEYYENYENMDPEIMYYKEGEWGYIIMDRGSVFTAVYYIDDTLLWVHGGTEENAEYGREFIRELGLPLK